MKLWLISQTENNGYDTYDSAVVASETEEGAKKVHPSYGIQEVRSNGCWVPISSVKAQLIGRAVKGTKEGDVFCASFNAG